MTSFLEYIEHVLPNVPDELVLCKVENVVQTMRLLVLQAEPCNRLQRCDDDCCEN